MKPLVIVAAATAALAAAGTVLGTRLDVRPPASAPPQVTAAARPAATAAVPMLRSVTLRVDNMYCPSCPYIVRRALEQTPGVVSAAVSLRDRRAVVTYDARRTDVRALIGATTAFGYPSRVADAPRPAAADG